MRVTPDDQVSEDQIARLIPGFYARVRGDALIGPVFDNAIGDWEHHLEKLVGRYKGNPVAAHLKHLPTITPPMFDRWLMLWTDVTGEMLPAAAAATLQQKAARIAASLQLALYFRLPPTSGTTPRPVTTLS